MVKALLSATMPDAIKSLCETYIKDSLFVDIESEEAKNDIVQTKYYVEKKHKIDLLLDLTKLYNPNQCIIFCNTRLEVDEVHHKLSKMGYPARALHGGMMQEDRSRVMEHFRRGKFRYLVATDVAARGMNIHDLSLVINYDVPEEAEIYVHRIGRTGRKDACGQALSFVTKRDQGYMQAIEDLLESPVMVAEAPSSQAILSAEEAFESKLQDKIKLKTNKADQLNESILKLHINAGKN